MTARQLHCSNNLPHHYNLVLVFPPQPDPHMNALLNLPSRGGSFTRVVGAFESVRSPRVPGTSQIVTEADDPDPDTGVYEQDLPNVRYDNCGNLREYVCDHNVNPPAHQHITTDKTNVLIRQFASKKSKDALAGRGSNQPGCATSGGSHLDLKKEKGPPGFEKNEPRRERQPLEHPRPSSSGLERANKKPTLAARIGVGAGVVNRPVGGTHTAVPGSNPGERGDDSGLDSFSVHELKQFLKSKGVTGAVLQLAGRNQLLAQSKALLAAAGARGQVLGGDPGVARGGSILGR